MDDFGSPLLMMRMLTPLLVVGPILVWMLVVGPFVLYLVARWRAHREPVVDPQLGLKTALHFFGMIGFQVALLGAMLFVWMIITKEQSNDRGSLARVAFGFLIPALIIVVSHQALLRRTNQRELMGVTRLFQGYNLIVTGLAGMTALFLVFQALLAKGSSGELGRVAGAMLVVYGSAWVACGIQFARVTFDGPSEPPMTAMPQAPLPQPPGQVLPSLGGGAFPPIEPK